VARANRDGAASAFIEPRAWPDTLTRRWKTEVGEGYATPIVIWRDRLRVLAPGRQRSAHGARGANAELIVARSSRSAFQPLMRYTVADGATWAQPAISGNRMFVKDVLTLTLWTLEEGAP
jgi:hypothetical protein